MIKNIRLLLPTLLLIGSQANAANVLVVLSDSDTLQLRNGKTHATGFYFNELMQPVKMLIDAGDTVVFATPKGRAPALDTHSVSVKDFGGNQQALDSHLQLLNKLQLTDPQHSPVISLSRVEQIGYNHFDAVFVPGGHAPMQDLAISPEMGKLLQDFHRTGKTTALICHGTIALISTLPSPDKYTEKLTRIPTTTVPRWIYSGYHMTAFSNPEEEASIGMFTGDRLKFTPQNALMGAGARYEMAPQKWQSHVVEDRELITGQNPASAADLGKALLTRLTKK